MYHYINKRPKYTKYLNSFPLVSFVISIVIVSKITEVLFIMIQLARVEFTDTKYSKPDKWCSKTLKTPPKSHFFVFLPVFVFRHISKELILHKCEDEMRLGMASELDPALGFHHLCYAEMSHALYI